MDALNSLAAARAGVRLSVGATPHIVDTSQLTASQSSVVRWLGTSAGPYLTPPEDLQREEALEELLHCKDLYEVGDASMREPYDADRLRVTKGDLQPREISTVCGEDALPYILSPGRFIVKGSEELRELADSGEAPRFHIGTRC